MALSSEEVTRQATHQIRLVTHIYTSNNIPSRQAAHLIILVTHVYANSIIRDGKRMKRIHSDKCCPSCCFRMTWHKATCHRISPTQFLWRQLWGLRPSASYFASMEAPDLSSSATTSTWPFSAARFSGVPRGGGPEARPTGQGVSEGKLLENSQAAQAARIPKISKSNTNMLTPSGRRMPGRNTNNARKRMEPLPLKNCNYRGWEGLEGCPGDLRNIQK